MFKRGFSWRCNITDFPHKKNLAVQLDAKQAELTKMQLCNGAHILLWVFYQDQAQLIVHLLPNWVSTFSHFRPTFNAPPKKTFLV